MYASVSVAHPIKMYAPGSVAHLIKMDAPVSATLLTGGGGQIYNKYWSDYTYYCYYYY